MCPRLLRSGLTYKKLNRLEDALDCFLKLHAILRNSSQVMYQLAHLYPPRWLCRAFAASDVWARTFASAAP